MRNMKKIDKGRFLDELLTQHWEYVYFFGNDPNAMWEIWKYWINMHHFNEKRSDHIRSLGSQAKLRASFI